MRCTWSSKIHPGRRLDHGEIFEDFLGKFLYVQVQVVIYLTADNSYPNRYVDKSNRRMLKFIIYVVLLLEN